MAPSKATIFVTGGAGFIGSDVIRRLLNGSEAALVNVDKNKWSVVKGATTVAVWSK